MANINGTNASDVLNGSGAGTGDDVLRGLLGADTYVFSAGNGIDTVSEEGDASATVIDKLQFTDKAAASFSFSRSGTDLVIDAGGADRVTVVRQFDATNRSYRVEQMVDSTGLTYSLSTGLTGTSGRDVVVGTDGNETIGGAGGDDILFGGAGDDTLNGGAGNDTLIGGAGNDTLNGGKGTDTASYAEVATGVTVSLATTAAQNTGSAGTDTLLNIENLTGGSGNDILTGNSGNNVLNGGGGTDTASYAGITSAVTVSLAIAGIQATGGAGSDTLLNIENLTGGSGNDTLTGNAGNNIIDGGAGNDTLIGDAGDDTLNGGNGTDTASYAGVATGVTVSLATTAAQNTGSAGTDTLLNIENLTGGSGNDILTGNSGDNVLNGGSGTDTASYAEIATGVTVSLATTTAQNTGGAGTDTLVNIENLTGGSGNDTLTGNAGNNVIDGGAGNDTLIGGAGDDTLNGGDGIDTASYVGTAGTVTVSLAITGSQATGGAGSDTLLNIENLIGGSGNDTLTGNAGNNVIDGGAGNDTVIGDAGDDTLNGGSGTDTASYAEVATGVTVSLATTAAQNTGSAGTDTLLNIENLTGGSGNDILTGNSGNNVLNGGGGTDTASYAGITSAVTVSLAIAGIQATGGAGSDTLLNIENLIGGSGNDTLTGNAGNNVIDGGAGNDTLIGGAGDDTLNGGDGIDTASYVGTAGAVTVSLALTGIQATGGAGSDTLLNIENLTGGSGNDTLTGNAGNNLIDGGAGNDTVIGDAGDDTLTGNDGDDTLIGGAGNDTLNGGAGSDVYRYVATVFGTDVGGGQADTIAAGTGDRIDFSSGLEGLLKIGGVSLSALTANTALGSVFDDTNNIRFSSGHLQIDVDGDQVFTAAQDFDVAVNGAGALSYNATTDMFELSNAAATKKIALTFDDGPWEYTSQVLSILDQYNVDATFFVIGEQVGANAALLQAEVAQGHLVENHSFTHPDLTTLSDAQIRSELLQTSNAIFAATGTQPAYYRPPYGEYDARVEGIANSLGLQTAVWTADTNDWQELGVNSIVNAALSQATDQGVILMHDGGGDRSQTVAALDDIIIGLRAAGYELVTLNQLDSLPVWDLG